MGRDLTDRLDRSHNAVLDAMSPELTDITDPARTRDLLARVREKMPTPVLPEGVVVEERTASHGAHAVGVRQYRTEASADGEPVPVVIWLHGGGTVFGDASFSDERCARFVDELGVVVYSVEYRLAPEHPYPAALDDCETVLRWVHANAFELGLDCTRVAVGGESAGGGIAVGLALRSLVDDLPTPAFLALVYPMLDNRTGAKDGRTRTVPLDPRLWNPVSNLLAWTYYLGPDHLDRDVPAEAVPARATDVGGLPPTYICVGDLDLFVDEDTRFVGELRRAGVPAELHVYPGAFHGSDTLVSRSDLSRRWQADLVAALGRGLGRGATVGSAGGSSA